MAEAGAQASVDRSPSAAALPDGAEVGWGARQQRWTADPRLVRRVAAVAALLATLLALIAPGIYVWSATARLRTALQADARLAAFFVTDEISRNPDRWTFGTVRLRTLLEAVPLDDDRTKLHRSLATVDGRIVVELGAIPAWPVLEVDHAVHDYGEEAARLTVAASLRGVGLRTLGIALGSAMLGLLGFLLLRLVPLRLMEAAIRRARHLASHDPLTGLANREQLGLFMTDALAEPSDGPVAVLVIDLDRFKPVNDRYGHKAGDELLVRVAQRLSGLVRGGRDCVSRIGGDEFVVVVRPGSGDPQLAVSALAERILLALGTPVPLAAGPVVQVGASIGAAVAPGHGRSAAELMARADAAMYFAKAAGRGTFRVFEPGMDAQLRERAELEAELRLAIERRELVPYFQPMVRLGTGYELIGFELLARWDHALRGRIPPDVFIPLAEATGLIGPLTELMLTEGCRVAARWPGDLMLAVNVSPLQLRDRSLPAMVRAALAASVLAASRLELELTETGLLDDFELARQLLGELRDIGVGLSLDDFGCGHSSLRHLQALPFDRIKLDASFVRSACENPDSRAIVEAVAGLGRSLGLATVAEGIETEALARLVTGLGYDIGQGWLFGRPAPAAEIEALIARAQTPAPVAVG